MSLARLIVTSSMAAAASRNGGVVMILSPAKTLNMSPTTASNLEWTTPDCDDEKTLQVVNAMKKQKEKDLIKLLGISANLAKKTHEYWTDFEVNIDERDESGKKPCIYAYSGAAFQGLESSTCAEGAMVYLQTNLRILSALYGVLRPLDVIQPYRLEMNTKNVLGDNQKLTGFWKPSITETLVTELQTRDDDKRLLVNLASDEYADAVDIAKLTSCGTQVIKVVFWEEGRVVTVHAKRARGLMARYLAEENVQTVKDMQKFDLEGYRFVLKESTETKLVFDRKKQQKKKAGGSTKRSSKESKPAAAAKKKRKS